MKANRLSLAIMIAAGLSQAARAGIIYQNDFEGMTPVGSEWSSNSLSTTPATSDQFLGEFGNQDVSLVLSGLATHTQVTVAFDLFILRSWDGNGQFGGGPDDWSLSDGSTLGIDTNFANFPGNTQAYPANIAPLGAGADNAPDTGAASVNTLGYQFNGTPMDAVYHLTATFTDSDSNLILNFNGTPNEDISNESWGLNNVVVSTDAVQSDAPEPSTMLLGGTVLLAALGIRRRRAA